MPFSVKMGRDISKILNTTRLEVRLHLEDGIQICTFLVKNLQNEQKMSKTEKKLQVFDKKNVNLTKTDKNVQKNVRNVQF